MTVSCSPSLLHSQELPPLERGTEIPHHISNSPGANPALRAQGNHNKKKINTAVVTKGTIVPPHSLVAGIPARVIKTLDESNQDNIHAQAIKYKDLWTKRYGLLPDNDGETYHGEQIV